MAAEECSMMKAMNLDFFLHLALLSTTLLPLLQLQTKDNVVHVGPLLEIQPLLEQKD